MKYLWKQMAIKLALALAAYGLLFLIMSRLHGQTAAVTFAAGWGGEPLVLFPRRIEFLLCCFLVYWLNLDGILLLLKDNAALTVRYGSRRKPLLVLLGQMALGQLCFILAGGLAGGWSLYLGRVWLFCLILSLIQILVTVTLDQAGAFLAYTVSCYLLAVMSCFVSRRWLILPVADVPMEVYLMTRLTALALLSGAVVLAVQRKEIQ